MTKTKQRLLSLTLVIAMFLGDPGERQSKRLYCSCHCRRIFWWERENNYPRRCHGKK